MTTQPEQVKTDLPNKIHQQKKKRSRLFETYIPKVLKEISDGSGIGINAKQQLNAAICIIARSIAAKVNVLTEIAKKKTLFEKEVYNALLVTLPSNMATGALAKGTAAIAKYKESKNLKSDGTSRQAKAGIIFPPSVTEKFLRHFDRSNVMVNNMAPYVFAAALEFIAAEILSLSSDIVKQDKRVRITIRDLELGVRQNPDMDTLFRRLNLSFIGGGVVPYIHESLLVKKTRKKKAKTDATPTPAEGEPKKPHRFRPGTVSLREIRRYQRTYDCLTFARSPFEKCVRLSIARDGNVSKISKDVFTILQHFIEQFVVQVLRDANFAAIHAGRRKLMPVDIKFVVAVKNGTLNPYNLTTTTDAEIETAE